MPRAKTVFPARKPGTSKIDQYDLKNLQFLVDFMKQVGVTPAEMSAKAGFSHATISAWLKRDDTILSNIDRALDVYGYQLIITYIRKDQMSGGFFLHIQGDLDPTTGKIRLKQDEHRLDFFDRGIKLTGKTREQIAGEMGLTRGTIYYYFRNDDILLSKINEFGEKQDFITRMDIVKKVIKNQE